MVCIIKEAKKYKVNTLQFTFSTEKFVSFNPQEGIPQLHYDQMNVIAANHHTARTGEKYWQSVDTVTPNITPNISKTAVPGLNDKHRPYTWEAKLEEKLTHGRLMRRDDWKDWEQSEFLQLDQYEIQNMFSDPTMLRPNETFNVLPMI